uniref:Uncharacterized protein n=1 Tax=Anguilla anguilla TaxID=7936 RepID=A0A0E9VKG4_ANGAN
MDFPYSTKPPYHKKQYIQTLVLDYIMSIIQD